MKKYFIEISEVTENTDFPGRWCTKKPVYEQVCEDLDVPRVIRAVNVMGAEKHELKGASDE